MRAEHKDGEDYASDMEFCDLDVENVDDLLEGADTLPTKKEKRKRSAANQSKAVANGATNSNASASVKSANSSWDEKFLQTNSNGNAANVDETYKSIFQIDSLVVVNDTTLPAVSSSSNTQGASKSRRGAGKQPENSDKSGSGDTAATAAAGVESGKSNVASSRSSNRKKSTKATKSAATVSAVAASATTSSSRPRMIHTEKSRLPPENASKKTRGRSYITRTSTNESSSQLTSQLVKSCGVSSSRIVDDYEIISPATHPPNQISSSPLHIKQEQEQQQQRTQFMYDDTHLMIHTAMLREKTYDKFNPSIVNDLEEILRSPLKHDRNTRLRFTSESSTTPQFLPEEEQNLIKIEPTSPDLRDMVESQQRVSAATGQTATPTSSSSSSAARTSRHLRELTAIGSGRRAASKRSGGKSSAAAGSNATKPSCNTSSTEAVSKSYLSYGVDSYNVSVAASANSSDVSSGFFSISEVVSAAHAADAAKAAAASKTVRRTRCFECEMCSSIFSDRAQLLEHMHIHI